MRKIKFRVWDIVWNKMRDEKDLWDIPYNEIFINTPDQRPLNIMQYTGLKDKNGKEIYEGDVLRIEDIIVKTVFEDGTFKFYGYNGEELVVIPLYAVTHREGDLNFDYEVIGNIYENQEL